MIYKTISCKVILAKIYRDLKPSMQGWEADAIEWIGEALEFIGYKGAFKQRSKTLNVKDYRVPFPQDFNTIIGVYYDDVKLPYGDDSIGISDDDSIYIAAKDQILETTNTPITRYGSRLYNSSDYDGKYYIVNPNYIITSFESGEIVLKYYAWPTDKDGLPEIPDNIYYKTALEWYILRQLIMRGFEHPNKEFTYSFTNLQWNKYCNSAQNNAAMPNPEQASAFRDMWVRMLPDYNLNFDNEIDIDTHG